MSISKYRKAFIKRPSSTTNIAIKNLKRENAFLLKTLKELTHHHNRITEKYLGLVDAGRMQQEPCSHQEKQSDVRSQRLYFYAQETEELKNELVSVSTRCQYLEDKVEKECSADRQDSDAIVTELQLKLKDAIVKTQQWVEYDQQREDDVKSILAKYSWLEKQLLDACNGRESDRNDLLLSEKKKIKQVEQYYEGLLQKAEEELAILKEQVCLSQRLCSHKESELEELRQQLQNERDELNPPQTMDDSEGSTTGAEDLQDKLKKERRKSATLELQSGHLQKYFVNHYHKAQRQIAWFKQTNQILLQDLHDEKENCMYLKQKFEQVQTQTEEKEQAEDAEQDSAEPSDKPPLPHCRSPCKSLMEDSYMECPLCHRVYAVSQYKELIEHLNYCQN